MATAKSKTDLITDADSFLPDNITEEISPGDVRDRIKDLASSFLNIIDGGNVVTQLTGYASVLTPSDNKHFANKKYVDDSIAGLVTGLTYQGTWNANTNTPAIVSGVGTNGYYYIVSVAGTTSIDGINDWQIGDWILYNGSAWQKIDQSTNWADGYSTYDARYLQLTGGTLSGSLTATSLIKTGGLSTEFLKADGSIDNNTYLTSSSLTPYAKLDGSNQPFTGGLDVQNTTGSGLTLKAIDDLSTSKSLVIKSSGGSDRLWFTGNRILYIENENSAFGGYYLRNSGADVFSINQKSTGTIQLVSRTNGIMIGPQTANNDVYFISAGDTKTTFTGSTGNWTFNGSTNQNKIILNSSIKIANNTQTAAAAGAGSVRYNSGLEVSDGATWNDVGGGVTDFAKETYSMADITGGGSMAGTAVWTKIIMSADCTVNRIGTFVTSASAETIYMGIYDNDGTKLVDGNVASGSVVAGINVATISDTTLQAGTAYWLCVKDNMTGAVNIGNKTTLADSNLCKAVYVGAGALPANQTGASANATSYYCFVAKV